MIEVQRRAAARIAIAQRSPRQHAGRIGVGQTSRRIEREALDAVVVLVGYVGDIAVDRQTAVAAEIQLPWRAAVRSPRAQPPAGRVDDLHAVVIGIQHEDAARGIGRKTADRLELACARAVAAPLSKEDTIARERRDPVAAGITDIHALTVRTDRQRLREPKHPLPGLAEHHHPRVRTGIAGPRTHGRGSRRRRGRREPEHSHQPDPPWPHNPAPARAPRRRSTTHHQDRLPPSPRARATLSARPHDRKPGRSRPRISRRSGAHPRPRDAPRRHAALAPPRAVGTDAGLRSAARLAGAEWVHSRDLSSVSGRHGTDVDTRRLRNRLRSAPTSIRRNVARPSPPRRAHDPTARRVPVAVPADLPPRRARQRVLPRDRVIGVRPPSPRREAQNRRDHQHRPDHPTSRVRGTPPRP